MNDSDCLIPLTQGKFAKVSPEDYEYLSQFKWCAQKQPTTFGYMWYAVNICKNRTIRMHHIVAKRAGLPESKHYDHKDRIGINNTRENLRPCTWSQNMANRTKMWGSSSKFKGVSWHKRDRIWSAKIQISGKQIHLGRFQDEADAHRAYTEAAVRYFGEFACP